MPDQSQKKDKIANSIDNEQLAADPGNNIQSDFPQGSALIDWFRKATPYINAHRGKTFVIMLSGDAIADEHIHNLIHDIVLLDSLGIKLIVVHGIRKQLDELLAKQGLKSQFVKGLRLTDQTTLDASIQASSLLRSRLESKLSMGLPNSPMHGARVKVASANVVTAQPAGIIEGVDLENTGQVRKIDHQAIQNLLDLGNIVLLSPIGHSPSGQAFNLSYQHLAGEIAKATNADKLIAFIGNDGVYDANHQLIHELTPNDAATWINEYQETQNRDDEVVLSVKACVDAINGKVQRAHLMSYARDGAILQELFSVDGSGTLIQKKDFEVLRSASEHDIPAILDIIRPLEKAGVLVRRERELLEKEIDYFTVIEREDLIIALAALYPSQDGKRAEIACITTHPGYRGSNRGASLLAHLEEQASLSGVEQIFVLTTQTTHWFLEQGFTETNLTSLPSEKQELYNFQRNSKILIKSI